MNYYSENKRVTAMQRPTEEQRAGITAICQNIQKPKHKMTDKSREKQLREMVEAESRFFMSGGQVEYLGSYLDNNAPDKCHFSEETGFFK